MNPKLIDCRCDCFIVRLLGLTSTHTSSIRIAMSEALDYRVDNDKVVALMRSSLVFLQQRILLWIAEESDIESTSSGLDKSQARTAV
jgi:hypothetical protein